MLGTVPFPYIPSKRPRGAKKRQLPRFGFVNVDIPEISASELDIVAEWTRHVDYVPLHAAVILRNSGHQRCGRWRGDLYLQAVDKDVMPLPATLFCKTTSANNDSLVQVYGLDRASYAGNATAMALSGRLESAGLKEAMDGEYQAHHDKAQDVASGLLSVDGGLWYRIPGLRLKVEAYDMVSRAEIALLPVRHGFAPDPFDAVPSEENHPLRQLNFALAHDGRVQDLLPGKQIVSDYDDLQLHDEMLPQYDGFPDFAARMMDRLAKTHHRRAGQMVRDELTCWMAMRDGVAEYRRSGVVPADAISKMFGFCALHHDLAETSQAILAMEKFHRGSETVSPPVALPRSS